MYYQEALLLMTIKNTGNLYRKKNPTANMGERRQAPTLQPIISTMTQKIPAAIITWDATAYPYWITASRPPGTQYPCRKKHIKRKGPKACCARKTISLLQWYGAEMKPTANTAAYRKGLIPPLKIINLICRRTAAIFIMKPVSIPCL